MQISTAFKNDTLSKNTQIIPVVIIEKSHYYPAIHMGSPETWEYSRAFLSTHNIEIDGNYFEPLLLDVPKFSQSIDFVEGKFKTTSLNLKISNVEYNGSQRMSERLDRDNMGLLNSVVSIHYKTQSCSKIQLPMHEENIIEDTDPEVGCPRVFVGVVRGIEHDKNQITLQIEDITDKKITKTLPNQRLGSENNIPEKYKNSPIPMFYGDLQNAPTVAYYNGGNLNFQADSRPINFVREDEVGGGITWNYNSLKLYSSQYVPLTKLVHVEFVSEDDATAELPFYGTGEGSQYTILDNGTISFKPTSMLVKANRVEVVRRGSPKSISLLRNYTEHIPPFHTFFSGSFSQEGTVDEHINTDDWLVITDNNYNTSINENHTTTYRWLAHLLTRHNIALLFSLQWDSGITGAKFIRTINNKINNIKIPVRGDEHVPSGFGMWNHLWGEMIISSIFHQLRSGNYGYGRIEGEHEGYYVEQVMPPEEIDLGGLVSFGDDDWHSTGFTESGTLWYNENAPFKITLDNFDPFFGWTDEGGNVYEEYWDRGDVIPVIRLSSGKDCRPSASEGWSSFEFGIENYGGSYNNPAGGDYDVNIDLDIQEIETTTLANFDNAIEKDYYLNGRGRYDGFLFDYQHTGITGLTDFDNPEILENPVDIIRHILVYECNINNDSFDEDEFNRAWCSRQNEQAGYSTYIKLAFSVNQEIGSKNLLSEISRNSLVYPYIKNNGNIGFIVKEHGMLVSDYRNATKINNDEIINYKFNLTNATELISKLDVEYGYDYAQKKNLKTTDSIEMEEDHLSWNSINDVEDSYKTYKANYIQDEQSALHLRNLIFYDRKSQHLEIDLTLPLSYSDLELGSLCKFGIQELIDGIKAHGINYTEPFVLGSDFRNDGVLRMPLFRIISINKNLDNVKCKLHQLHWLDNLENAYIELDTVVDGDKWTYINWEELEIPDDVGGQLITSYDPDFPQNPVQFTIGYSSEETVDAIFGGNWVGGGIEGGLEGQYNTPSSYVRHFVISDDSLRNNPHGEYTGHLADPDLESEGTANYFYLNWATDDFKNLFGENNFNESDWNTIINPANNDNFTSYPPDYQHNPLIVYMYGDIWDSVGVIPYMLKFQNVAGTEFDEEHEMYQDVPLYQSYWYSNIPEYLSAPDNNLPYKMMWVAYKQDGTINKAGQNMGIGIDVLGEDGEVFTKWWRRNLQIKFMTYNDITHGYSQLSNWAYNKYIFEMHINQDTPLTDTISGGRWEYNSGYQGFYFPFSDETYIDQGFDVGGVGGGGGDGGSPQEDSLGDVNLDGNVNVLDAVYLLGYILGDTDFSDESILNADMNQDEIIDILDVILLINIVLGNE